MYRFKNIGAHECIANVERIMDIIMTENSSME